MTDISISCIIPTLARGQVVCDTVGMLLAQSRPAHEIILVDQTRQHTAVIERQLKDWAAKGIIVWLRQAEANASKARNAGALAATGEVLLFLDDDIQIGPDYLAACAQVLEHSAATAVAGPILEGRAPLVYCLPRKAFTRELGWLLHFRKNYGCECETSFMMSGNVAIRRKVFLQLGGMDENYERGAHREESDFAMRFRAAGYRVRYDPRCALVHLGPESVPGGGARDGRQGKDFRYFHHCVGDWYFNLKFGTPRTAMALLAASLRHFVFNRQTFQRPWRFPLAMGYWLLGFPPAAFKRFRGAQLLKGNSPPGCRAFDQAPERG